MNDLIPAQLGSGALVDLAKAIGILDSNGELDPSWFNDPAQRMADLLLSPAPADHARRQALLRGVSQLLPEGSSSLRDDLWSLQLFDIDDGPSLDLLIRASASDGGPAAEVEIGVGGRWTVHERNPKVEIEAQVGLLAVDADAQQIRAAEGLDLAVTITELIDGEDDVLDGISVGIHLPFDNPEDIAATVTLVGVGPDNEDIRFSIDATPTWEEFEDPVLRLLVLAVVVLADQLPEGDGKIAVTNLLALFGWRGDPSLDYPALELDELLANPGLTLQNWLQEIWADADGDVESSSNKVHLFLTRLLAMLRADEALVVEDDGRYVVVRATALEALELLMWAQPDSTGAERLHLGLRVSAREDLGSSGPRLNFEAIADLLSFPLSGPIHPEVVGEFIADLRLGPRSGSGPAISVSASDLGSELAFLGDLEIGEVVAGLSLDLTGSFAPVLELRDLVIGPSDHQRSWAVLDLTNANAMIEAGEDIALGAVASAIRAALGTSEAGEALAILLGIDKPEAHLNYPQIDVEALVDSPVDAYEVWIGRLLGDRSPAPWFLVWLETFAGLVGLGPVSGSGSPGEPWQLSLSSGSVGAVAFEFAIRPDGAARTLQVDLAAGLSPLALGSTARFEARAVAGLLRLRIDDPNASDPSVDLTPVPGAWVDAALIPPEAATVISVDLGLARLEAARLVAGVAWERGGDPLPAVDLVDPAIVLDVGGDRFDLADLVSGLSLPSGSLPSLRYEGLGGLANFGIGAFDGGGVSLPGLSLPNFGDLDLTAPDFGLGSDGQWFVEIGEMLLALFTVGLPNWAFSGADRGGWQGWSLGIMQLLGGWPSFDLGSAGGRPIAWPSSGFDFDLPAFARFVRNPFEGLKLRLGQLFTLSGGGPAGMALMWRWIHGEMPNLEGNLDVPDMPEIRGRGTYEDPWAVRIDGASTDDFPVELIAWLDPEGPPSIEGAATPSHLGLGLRLDLAPEPIVPPYELDLYARVDLLTIDLSPVTGASGVARPTPTLRLEAAMRHEDPAGWLLDQDSSAVRLRAVEFALTWSPLPEGAGDPFVVDFELVDAGYQPGITGPADTEDLVGLLALSAGGVLLDRLAAPGGPLADETMAPLMIVLEVLGVAASAPEGGYHFLAVPMQRLIETPQTYLRERFWDTAHDLPRLRPLEPALLALGCSKSPDPENWWVAVPVGDHILRLEDNGTLHLGWGGELDAIAELAVEVTYNPFSGRTEGLVLVTAGAADLELLASWQDLDGYGLNPPSFDLRLSPLPDTDMARAFEGPLVLWPVADPAALGERVLTIGSRLAVEFAVAALFDALLRPELSPEAEANLIAFGLLEGSPGASEPAPLWLLFDDPVGTILDGLRGLRGSFAITDDFELYADETHLLLRTTDGASISLGAGASMALAAGVRTASWEPSLSTEFGYDLDGNQLSLVGGYDQGQPQLSVCGLQLLPNFAGFAGQFDAVDALEPLLAAALTGTLVGLDQLGDSQVDTVVSAIEGLMGASSDVVSEKYAAVQSYISDVANLVENPSLDWFTDARVKGILDALETCLGLITGLETTRLGDGHDDYHDGSGPPPSDANGTRTRVSVGGVPVAVILGRHADDRLGIWMVRNGTLDLGYVGIGEASRIGAFVTGSGESVVPGAECDLLLEGHIPDPVNLDPALRIDLDTQSNAVLTLFLLGSETPEDTSDDVAIQFLPAIDVRINDPMALLNNQVLPLVKELAALAGLTDEVLQQEVVGPLTLEQVLIASAALLAIAGGTAWAVTNPGEAMSLLTSSLDDLDNAISGDWDLVYSAEVTGGKVYGLQMPKLDPIELVSDPKLSLVLGTQTERPRIPLIFVPTGNPDGASFEVGLSLRDIGLHVTGAGGQPLLSEVIGIGAVQGTFDFDIGPKDWEDVAYGFGLLLEGIALPFGKVGQDESGSTSSGDPVAQSLMSEEGDNPGIDVEVGWHSVEGFMLRFPQAADPEGGRLELPLDMQFGPLELAALTVAAAAGAAVARQPIDFTFDGSFGLGPLDIAVDDFGLSIPMDTVGDPGTWSVTLSGLAVSFKQDPVEISAALLKQGTEPNVEYVGTAAVRVAEFELAAIGAYSKLEDGSASLFIFAMIPVPLGGPPAFFIEGVAGGFGYNRGFTTPKIDQVASHPLMAAMAGTDDLMGTLRDVQTVLPAKRGAYWFAAGVKFSSFVFIKGSALLYILFDRGFELGLLGHASIALPDASAAVLSVGLVLSVGFTTRGDKGPMLWAEAQLTEDSWVLHSSMRLTGGFALRMWFKSGETVLSIGGYHPAFQPPSGYEYPVVPRVGLRWQVSDVVTIKGECYFAITPREAMAGGALEATGKFGPVKAWFSAGVDILIGWDPFYYDLRMHIEIGFEVDLGLFDIRASVGVRLEVRGPELSGKATIDLSLVTFTVRFGASSDPKKAPLSVRKFAEAHLQLPELSGSASSVRADRVDDEGRGPFDFSVMVGVVPDDGEGETPQHRNRPIVRIEPEAVFSVRTRMPFTQSPGLSAGPRVDLLPSAVLNVSSVLSVDITDDGGRTVSASILGYEPRMSSLPKAMFLGRADAGETDEQARLEPAGGGESTTPLPDQLIIKAIADLHPSGVSTLSSDLRERAEYDHHLPLGEGGWSQVVSKQAIFAEAIDTHVWSYGVSEVRQRNVNELSTQVQARSYLTSLSSPEAAASAALTTPPSEDSSGGDEGGSGFVWRFTPTLEAVGVIFPASSRVSKSSALTQTSVRSIRSAARSAKVPAPTVAERDHSLLGVRLHNVRSADATVSGSTVGRSVYRRGRISSQARQAFRELSTKISGSRQGVRVAAGVTQIFDVPGDGLPPARHASPGMRLEISGNQVGRLVFLGLGGQVLADLEFGSGQHTLDLPRGTKRVVVAGLGQPSAYRKVRTSGGKRPGGKLPGKKTREQILAERAAAQKEAARLAAQKEAARLAAQKEAARIAAQKQAAQLAAKQEAARLAAEKEAARLAAEKQAAAKLAAQREAARKQRAAQLAARRKRAAQLAAKRKAAQLAAQREAAKREAAQREAAKQEAASKPSIAFPGVRFPTQQGTAVMSDAKQGTQSKTPISNKQATRMNNLSRMSQMRGNRGLNMLGGNRFAEAKMATIAKPAGMNIPQAVTPQKAAMLAELARKQQLAESIRDRLTEQREAKLEPINLGLPRGRGQALFTSRYARRDVACVGFDDGSRLLRVGARTFLARGATVEVVEGLPRTRPLEAALARDVLVQARELRVRMPASARCLIVLVTSSVSGREPVAQAVDVSAKGGRLSAPRQVVIPGRSALIYDVQNAKGGYTATIEVPRGFRIVGVVGGPPTAEHWARRLAALDEWDIVEDGPIAPSGSTNLRLEVLK